MQGSLRKENSWSGLDLMGFVTLGKFDDNSNEYAEAVEDMLGGAATHRGIAKVADLKPQRHEDTKTQISNCW